MLQTGQCTPSLSTLEELMFFLEDITFSVNQQFTGSAAEATLWPSTFSTAASAAHNYWHCFFQCQLLYQFLDTIQQQHVLLYQI